MMLRVLVPQRVLLEREVRKVVADGAHGSFGLLPHHVDFVAVLRPGILAYVPVSDDEFSAGDGEDTRDESIPDRRERRGDREQPPEEFLAVDRGILVKEGPEVLVSVREAVEGVDLGELEDTVRTRFALLDEEERQMRNTLARLEADFVRRYTQLREPPS